MSKKVKEALDPQLHYLVGNLIFTAGYAAMDMSDIG